MRKSRYISIVAIITPLCWALAVPAIALTAKYARSFYEGNDFGRQLVAPLSVSWSGMPLRDATAGLSRAQNVAIVLDRRIDPEQQVSLSVSQRPLSELLSKLATSKNLECFYLGSVIYLAPAGEAARLQAAVQSRRDELNSLAPVTSRRLRKKAAMAWDDLAEPAKLLDDLARQGGLSIVNPQRLPHDLWAAGSLPRLTLTDRFSFVLGQFGLTYEILPAGKSRTPNAGSTIRIVDIPDVLPTDNQHSHNMSNASSRTSSTRKNKQKITNKHREVVRIERFSVSEVRLEALLTALTSRLGLQLELDREAIHSAGINLEQLVSLSVAGVTPDELFENILKPRGLTYDRTGTTIRIGSAEPHSK